jgi:cytidylate kinase
VSIPVIAIDGPSASGKGTVAQQVATRLGFHYLESGALYRLVAYLSLRDRVAADDERRLAELAAGLDVVFADGRKILSGQDVTDALTSEECARRASLVAQLAAVRAALIDRQRAFRRPPGLVADGRDMGTVVFPDAALKVFLTASVPVRAQRRYNQLKQKGIDANIDFLSRDLEERDRRDSARAVAPLAAAPDALRLDSSELSIDAVVGQVLAWYRDRTQRGSV